MTKHHFMPLFLNLHNKYITIFGGGKVGERKAMLFCKYAKVRVISHEFTLKLTELSSNKQIKLISTENILNTADLLLHDTFIAIICTNDRELNAALENSAKERGVLRNVVDVPDPGDIIVPSISDNKGLTVAVSTQGSAPLISRQLRKRIEVLIRKENWFGWLEILTRARNKAHQIFASANDRKKVLYTVFEDKIINEHVYSNNLEYAKKRSDEILLEYSKTNSGGIEIESS